MASTTMRPPWMEKPSAATQTAKTVVLVALTIVMLLPFVYVIAVSFSSPQDVREGSLILFPTNPPWPRTRRCSAAAAWSAGRCW